MPSLVNFQSWLHKHFYLSEKPNIWMCLSSGGKLVPLTSHWISSPSRDQIFITVYFHRMTTNQDLKASSLSQKASYASTLRNAVWSVFHCFFCAVANRDSKSFKSESRGVKSDKVDASTHTKCCLIGFSLFPLCGCVLKIQNNLS